MTGETTFRQIERELSIGDEQIRGDSSLGRWYQSVRDKSLRDFGDEDLSIAIRQELYLNYTTPVAIGRLEENPLAGEKYDGELVVALGQIDSEFWAAHADLAKRLRGVLTSISNYNDPQLTQDVSKLLASLG